MSSHQKGLFKFLKNLDVCLGVMAHWMEHRPVNQRGLQVGFPVRTHAWQEKICGACGEDAVTDGMCQKWIVKFHSGDLSQG